METIITIDSRFNGPPDSGHGGYVSGVVADFIEGTAEVTLRKPPPMDKPLIIRKNEDDSVLILDNKLLIAEGRPGQVTLSAPEPPTFEQAQSASNRYIGTYDHYFPTCFGCGPERPEPDGLQLATCPIIGTNQVAAPWTPAPDLGDENGRVYNKFIWTALDCPGGYAILGADPTPVVLGRLAVRLINPVFASQQYIVTGWKTGQEGRKHYTGTAVFTEDGRLCALGQATWITIKGDF